MRKVKNVIQGAFLFAFVILSVFIFSGCQSLAGTFGIATEQYVDEKVSESEGKLSAQVDGNRSKIDTYAETADKLEELIGSVEDTVRTTEELKQLAVVLEERLNDLPKETITQLVDVLQQYLDAQDSQ